jgi:hypothetical protein
MSKIEVNQISSQCGSTLTIGQSGDTVTLASGATQSGFGRTGTVDWDTTAKTASFTAVSGNGYFVNTTSTAITVTLPAGSAGSIVSLKDYASTWNTNSVTLTPNGTDKINGTNADAALATQDQSVTLVYVDSTKGWRAVQDSTSDVTGFIPVVATGGTITTCGDYKIHTFTGPGTFCVSSLSGNPTYNNVDYIVVAGGGAGGHRHGSGGGAGGFRESHCSTTSGCYTASPLASSTSLPISVTGYPITVGAGAGSTSFPPNQTGASGSNSVFSTITSAGGGGGGTNCQAGTNGGSGGGGGADNLPTSVGSGNTPPVSPPQGNPGGVASYAPVHYGMGGGGGATAAGGTGSPNVGGNGGAGATTSISGSPTAYAGGGGASVYEGGTSGTGGTGGGGTGTIGGPAPNQANGTDGTANTGGGGGGGERGVPQDIGRAGGSGIVIIRYKYQ